MSKDNPQPPLPATMDTDVGAGVSRTSVVRCRTVAEGHFRQLNYLRDLPPYVIEQRLGLEREDAAPTPLEAVLAALGSCLTLGLRANGIMRGITISSLSIELEAEFDASTIWGTPDRQSKPLGFNTVRALIRMDADAHRLELEDLVSHVLLWSPVSNSLHNPMHLEATLA